MCHPCCRTCNVMQQYLPEKVEQVVFCKMSPLQLKLYNHFLQSAPVQRALYGRVMQAQAKQQQQSQKQKQQSEGVDSGAGGPGDQQAAGDGPSVLLVAGSSATAGGAVPAAGASKAPSRGSGRGGASTGPGAAAGPRDRSEDLSVLATITAVKKLCCHPDLVGGRVSKLICLAGIFKTTMLSYAYA